MTPARMEPATLTTVQPLFPVLYMLMKINQETLHAIFCKVTKQNPSPI